MKRLLRSTLSYNEHLVIDFLSKMINGTCHHNFSLSDVQEYNVNAGPNVSGINRPK